MTAITSRLFAKNNHAEVDEEQLLRLFWNRAELKKELAALEKEMAEVEEKTRQKDALVLRIQQRLVHLEALLTDPASAGTVVTYYQLRGVWNRCNQILESLATELRRTYHDRAYQDYVERRQKVQHSVTRGIEREYAEVCDECDRLALAIRDLRDQRKIHRGLLQILKRRRLTTEINLLREQRRTQKARLQQILNKRSESLDTDQYEFAGLDVGCLRRINLIVIACAQELYLFFQNEGIANLAREASISQVNDVQYGSNRECRRIRQQLAERMRQLELDQSQRQRIEKRSRLLRSQVEYRSDSDAVPMAGSLAMLPLLDSNGEECGEISLNVLADEYWDLFAVLLA